MNTLDIWLLAVALAMDCFTVSIVGGVITRRFVARVAVRMAVLFGLFQALMPFIGWLCTTRFRAYIESFDHWIAFALLAFLGVKMVKDAFSPDDDHHFDPCRLRTQLVMAVATSIDALAVGISFACLGYERASALTGPLAVIGFVSLALSLAGTALGVRFGRSIARRLKPELLGGVILIAIGVKILYSHLA